MTIGNYRAHEPLYVVIVRDRGAENLLREWSKTNAVQATIEDNKMKLYEHRALSQFQMTWNHSLENVTVWDTWNKRHIDLV